MKIIKSAKYKKAQPHDSAKNKLWLAIAAGIREFSGSNERQGYEDITTPLANALGKAMTDVIDSTAKHERYRIEEPHDDPNHWSNPNAPGTM